MKNDKKIRSEYIDAYLDYYPTVYSIVYTSISDKEDADDICQEIFLIFYNKFESIENKRRWLYSTTKNILLNYYKKKRSITVNYDFNDAGLKFINGFRDTRILIEEAIDNVQCDDIERIMLDMIAVHNFTYTRTAKIIGLTVRQVKYRYDMVLRKLVDYLKNIGINNIEDLL